MRIAHAVPYRVDSRKDWTTAVASVFLVVCVRGLAPYLFVERPITAPAIASLFALVTGYTFLWRMRHRGSARGCVPDALWLTLALSGAVVVLDPHGGVPPRWLPADLQELPGILGVLAFLVLLTGWLFQSTVGLWMNAAGEQRAPAGATGRGLLSLPLLFYLVWSCVENLVAGRVASPAIVLGFAALLLLVRLLPGRGWMNTFFLRVGGMAKKCVTLFSRDDRAFAVMIGLFAFALRAAFAVQLNRADMDPRLLGGPDSGVYDEVGWSIASGAVGLLHPGLKLYAYNPGPSLFYALIYKLIGHHPDWVRIFQAGLSALTIVLLFRLAVTWFGQAPARIGAFLIAGRGYLLVYGTYLGSETLGLFLLTLVVLLLFAMQRRSKEGEIDGLVVRAAGAGLLLGALILTRPEYQIFLLAAFAWLWFVVKARRLWVLASFLLGAFVILVPMMARNHASVGHFGLNNPQVIETAYRMPSLNRHVGRAPRGIFDKDYLARAARSVAGNPLAALRGIGGDMAVNFYEFWNWKRYVNNPAFVFFFRNERVMMLIGASLTAMLIVGLLSSGHLAASLSLLYVLIGVKTLIHLILHSHEWWRFTVEPFINLFQGYGIYAWVGCVMRNRTGSQPAAARAA
ncbi:MAG: glycosyltransferase family 39 protein [Nitrospinota bacterium]